MVARGDGSALDGDSDGFCFVQDALRPNSELAAAENDGLRGIARTASADRGDSGLGAAARAAGAAARAGDRKSVV